LEHLGSQVEDAGGGTAGVRAYRARPADVVLCDVFMPEGDGLEVIRELRREFPAVKVVSVSGGGFEGSLDVLPVAARLGASATLYKPFDRAKLLAAIERGLGAQTPELRLVEG
jgi:CheY-like chemotaxis protein